jgi:hypothetical protein
MTQFASPVTSFGAAENFLGGKDWRAIGHNTAIIRRSETTIAVLFHSTDVVTFHLDGRVTFNTGGWESVTTKVRMNALSPCSVWSEGGTWAIMGPSGDSARFEDGVTLDAAGTFQNWKEARFLLRESRARRLAIKDAEIAAWIGESPETREVLTMVPSPAGS